VPIGGKYPPSRAHQWLSSRGHSPHLRPDTVQFRVTQPTHREHLSARHFFPAVSVEILAPSRRRTTRTGTRARLDAVRQAQRHFLTHEASLPHLAGDHLYRMDYRELIDAHGGTGHRHHHRRTTGGSEYGDADGHLPLRARRRMWRSKRSPKRRGSMKSAEHPAGRKLREHSDAQPSWPRWRLRVLTGCAARDPGPRAASRFRPGAIPAALGKYKSELVPLSALLGRRSARWNRFTKPTSCSSALAPFRFWDPTRPIYTDLSPSAGTHVTDSHIRHSIITEGCYSTAAEITESIRRLRRTSRRAADHSFRVARRGLLRQHAGHRGPPAMGIGRDVVLGSRHYRTRRQDRHRARW